MFDYIEKYNLKGRHIFVLQYTTNPLSVTKKIFKVIWKTKIKSEELENIMTKYNGKIISGELVYFYKKDKIESAIEEMNALIIINKLSEVN